MSAGDRLKSGADSVLTQQNRDAVSSTRRSAILTMLTSRQWVDWRKLLVELQSWLLKGLGNWANSPVRVGNRLSVGHVLTLVGTGM